MWDLLFLIFVRCLGPVKSASIVTAVTLVLQRSLKEIAELYGSEKSLHGVEQHRKISGLQSITSACCKAAKFSAILIDDGLELDKSHGIEWHKSLAPVVGRILRIERLAEKILDQVRCFWI